jgi:hypothetical protein
MNGLFEGARQIVASEVVRLRSLGGRRRHAAQKMWLARHTPPKPPVEQDSSMPDKTGTDCARAASD